MHCFEKDQQYALCMPECNAGVAERDPGEKPWSCKQLSTSPRSATLQPVSALGGLCAARGENCRELGCCRDAPLKCFEKNDTYATCRTRCQVGIHQRDQGWQPWTCRIVPRTARPEEARQASAPSSGPATTAAAPPVACDGGLAPALPTFSAAPGPAVHVKVLTYNLFWWSVFGLREGNNNSAEKLIASTSHPEPYDLMAFQECEGINRIIEGAGLDGAYQSIAFDPLFESAALCMAFRKSSFRLLAKGQAWIAEKGEATLPSNFGRRAAQWMRLNHTSSGRALFFINHHGGPLTVSSGGRCGGEATAYRLLRTISANTEAGDAVIMVGDFNAEPGSVTVQKLSEHLHEFYRSGVDVIFTNLPMAAMVQATNCGNGGSDHDAICAVLNVGSGRGAVGQVEGNCTEYEVAIGCNWTSAWSCPGQPCGREGNASDDGSLGYACCCTDGGWQDVL